MSTSQTVQNSTRRSGIKTLIAKSEPFGARSTVSESRRIVRDSPIPYHYQLFEILRDGICNGAWKPGEMILSETELEATYHVSRTVIRNALQRLADERFVERSKGKRAVVLPVPLGHDADNAPRFAYDTAIGERAWFHGFVGSAYPGRVIDSSLAACGAEVGNCLAIPAEHDVFQLTCVHRGEGMPNSLTRLFIRADATPSLRDLAHSHRLPELTQAGPSVPIQLEMRYDLRLSRSEATIEAKACNEFEAGALDIQPGLPVFAVSTISYAPDGRRVACGRIVFCTKRAAFTVTIRHDQQAPEG
jgi:DNA-binding GntR family transcriptional regulator